MNVLEWVHNFIRREITISDKWISQHSTREYWKHVAKLCTKFLKESDFAIELQYVDFPQELYTLTEQQKTETLKYISTYAMFEGEPEPDDYAHELYYLVRVCADYERHNQYENPIAQAFIQNYEWLKNVFFDSYPQESQVFEGKRNFIKQKPQPIRPNCIECGSKHVVSNGSTWLCRECGR